MTKHSLDTPLQERMAVAAAEMADDMADFGAHLETTLNNIAYRPNYHIESGYEHGMWWVEVVHERHDAITGAWGQGRGGKRWITREMSMSDVVRTVFGAFVAYEEHEVREFFRYAGQQVFGPHQNIHALAIWLRERKGEDL